MLTPKQQRFVEEYLLDLNATQAAIRAGYSKKTADQQASRLLANVKVAKAIAQRRQKLTQKLEITQERVLREYAKLAFSDIRQVAKWGESVAVKGESSSQVIVRNALALIASAELSEDTAAAVEEVSETRQGLKIKMHDKKGALDSLARHLGLFEKDNAQKAVTVVINASDADVL